MRLRPQIRIRTLLVLVALFSAWLGLIANSAHDQRRTVAMIQAAGGEVCYDYECDVQGTPDGIEREKHGPRWLRELVGDHYFVNVVYVSLAFTDSSEVVLPELTRLRKLEFLDLAGTPMTDAHVTKLASLRRLRLLDLGSTRVTDAGLLALKRLKRLRELNVSKTRVTDRGLTTISSLTQLRSLNLEGTRVTDAGLAALAALASLEHLDLRHTGITDDGLKSLVPLRRLSSLSLAETGVTDRGLPSLRQLGRLESLHLWGPGITDGGLRELYGHTSLKYLWLNRRGAPGLVEIRILDWLDRWARDRPKITSRGLAELQQVRPTLEVQW